MMPCARAASSSFAEMEGSTTSNSSPPRRPTWPASPITSRNLSETSRSKVSPAGWPSVSLTALKRSRSMRKIEQRCFLRTAPSSASSNARRSISRLARPVSESCRASRSSSTSDCRILVRSEAKPRKPKKRPTSSCTGRPRDRPPDLILGLGAYDQVLKCDVRREIEAERALRCGASLFGIGRDQVGKRPVDQVGRVPPQRLGDAVADVGQGPFAAWSPKTTPSRCFQTPASRLSAREDCGRDSSSAELPPLLSNRRMVPTYPPGRGIARFWFRFG